MGSFSLWHWIILGGIVLVLFGGKGKISDLMGDFAKGIKSFKKGLADEDEDKPKAPADPKSLDQPTASLNTKVSDAAPASADKAKVL